MLSLLLRLLSLLLRLLSLLLWLLGLLRLLRLLLLHHHLHHVSLLAWIQARHLLPQERRLGHGALRLGHDTHWALSRTLTKSLGRRLGSHSHGMVHDLALKRNQASVVGPVHALHLVVLLLLHILHLIILRRQRRRHAFALGLKDVPEHQPPLIEKPQRSVHQQGYIGQVVFLQNVVNGHSRRQRGGAAQPIGILVQQWLVGDDMGRCLGGQMRQVVGHGGEIGLADKALGGLRQRVLDEEVVDVCVQQLLGISGRGIGDGSRGIHRAQVVVAAVVDFARRQIHSQTLDDHPRRSLVVQMRGALMAHGGPVQIGYVVPKLTTVGIRRCKCGSGGSNCK